MYFLNTGAARCQIARYEQGVTRPRINTGNLKRIYVGLPTLQEQNYIVLSLAGAEGLIRSCELQREELIAIKRGRMYDLLTGRVRVKILAAA